MDGGSAVAAPAVSQPQAGQQQSYLTLRQSYFAFMPIRTPRTRFQAQAGVEQGGVPAELEVMDGLVDAAGGCEAAVAAAAARQPQAGQQRSYFTLRQS